VDALSVSASLRRRSCYQRCGLMMPADYAAGSSPNRWMTPRLANRTSSPAMTMPKAIQGNDFLLGRPINRAASAPVHAPVPGSGIATRRSSPTTPHCSIQRPLRRLRANTLSRILRVNRQCMNSFSIHSRPQSSMGTMAKLPSTANKNAIVGESPCAKANGIPPRSSMSGAAEMPIVSSELQTVMVTV
jgi:hypothetical protein